MKVTEEFLQAKKDKKLDAFMVVQQNDTPLIRLAIASKYSAGRDSVECPTEIRIESFGGREKEIKKILFYESIYHTSEGHVATFLKAIKKDSDVRFRVVAFNACENYERVGFESHQLYGIINERVYLLVNHVGPQNLASPAQI